MRFPSMQAAHDFLNSPEYAPIKQIRLNNSAATLIVFEGI
ncbi:MAG: DUF1330 domain-containing protein [Candidatus Puniceispirillum sp.]